jgi:hypothetical protein
MLMALFLFTLQLSIVLGMGLTVVLGLAMRFGAGIFTSDLPVIEVIHKGIPVRTWPGYEKRAPFVKHFARFRH